jgi:hypothetical protein
MVIVGVTVFVGVIDGVAVKQPKNVGYLLGGHVAVGVKVGVAVPQ